MKTMMAYLEQNAGRIPQNINLDDYSDQELLTLLKELVETRFRAKMDVDGGVNGTYSQVLINRLIS
jgi:hypothetical protein